MMNSNCVFRKYSRKRTKIVRFPSPSPLSTLLHPTSLHAVRDIQRRLSRLLLRRRRRDVAGREQSDHELHLVVELLHGGALAHLHLSATAATPVAEDAKYCPMPDAWPDAEGPANHPRVRRVGRGRGGRLPARRADHRRGVARGGEKGSVVCACACFCSSVVSNQQNRAQWRGVRLPPRVALAHATKSIPLSPVFSVVFSCLLFSPLLPCCFAPAASRQLSR